MRSEQAGGTQDGSAFSEALATLKRNGSNVVVVGAEDRTAHERVCQRLLGTDAPRTRLVVRTTPGGTCGWLPPTDADGETHLITYGDPGEERDATIVDSDLLGPLGQAVADKIDAVTAGEGPEPAEFRVCLDALGPLFAEHDPETVFRLVHVVTARVRDVNGMGHFHLRLAPDDDHIKLLEPLFDAVVEVRTTGAGAQHRWRLLDKNVDSQWIEL
ncbi:hypothetical protein L593_01445 [Salinarchaeum sp. Harcht-Bsk1]|uniref:DUF7504 family protein n=1 Tax=Salinarchaeum sp. Harcht-Bsk1 TaxID=1333523 RepID=UPI0003423EF3|nr:hypothetical protein [Salinarchaeum sp. Harcht-Bsk1]AGN00242.1 hypothetical protein L593_01445 [Salinarchaeum sp. Harcht-Bsk1]